jgi:glutaredoxin
MFTIDELRAVSPLRIVSRPQCPHCQHTLEPFDIGIAISSRCCVKCGQRLVAQPAPIDAPRISHRELQELESQQKRVLTRMVWMVSLLFLPPLIVMVPVALFMESIVHVLTQIMARETAKAFVFWLVFGPMVVGCFVVFINLIRNERSAPRCPHCKRDLTRLLWCLVGTGNCVQCGQSIADHPPAESARVPRLLSVNELLAIDSKHANWCMRPTWIGLVLSVMFGIAGVVVSAVPPPVWPTLDIITQTWLQVVLALIVICPGAIGLSLTSRRFPNSTNSIPCPNCTAPLTSTKLLIVTKRCPKCQVCVIEEPSPV